MLVTGHWVFAMLEKQQNICNSREPQETMAHMYKGMVRSEPVHEVTMAEAAVFDFHR